MAKNGPALCGTVTDPSVARKYNLTLAVSAANLLNYTNYSPRALAGGNRKIDAQLRLTF
jgi:hypothetical protein